MVPARASCRIQRPRQPRNAPRPPPRLRAMAGGGETLDHGGWEGASNGRPIFPRQGFTRHRKGAHPRLCISLRPHSLQHSLFPSRSPCHTHTHTYTHLHTHTHTLRYMPTHTYTLTHTLTTHLYSHTHSLHAYALLLLPVVTPSSPGTAGPAAQGRRAWPSWGIPTTVSRTSSRSAHPVSQPAPGAPMRPGPARITPSLQPPPVAAFPLPLLPLSLRRLPGAASAQATRHAAGGSSLSRLRWRAGEACGCCLGSCLARRPRPRHVTDSSTRQRHPRSGARYARQ